VPRPALIAVLFVASSMCVCSTVEAHGAASPPSQALGSDTVRTTVTETAAIVAREYLDATVGERVAESLLRRLSQGEYAGAATAEGLAALLTRHLLMESQDKHLSVALVREPAHASASAPPTSTREDGVRRSNGGVQRVEILPGNVGYLNLTAFWRLDEARGPVTDAMRLLRRADALIVDMRQNGGGSPETVALLIGYLFDDPGLSLFDIVSRSGNRVAYATPVPGPSERDERRPVYVLTASRTFSAAEGFAFLLQERARAEVIGERTAGAANPGRPYRVSPLFEVTVPNGKVRSAVSGKNWEGAGVTPDVSVAAPDALHAAHVRALQALLKREPPGAWYDVLERQLKTLAPDLREPGRESRHR
jgi:hypothetical protein